MIKETLDMIINHRSEEVFAILSDLTYRPKWEPAVVRTKKISAGPIRIGTEYLEVYQPLLTERIKRTIVVSEYELNKNISYSYEGFSKFTKGTTTIRYSFVSHDDSTKLTVENEVALSGNFKLGDPLVAFNLRRQVKRACESMKKLCEGNPCDEEDPRDDRYYGYSSLPVLNDLSKPLTPEQQNVLLELYKEICTSWRALVDVRFKLLGLVPAVSIAIIVALLTAGKDGPRLSLAIQTGIALFGLAVTVGLLAYDRRNSELHDDLISRGRRIERELGIDTGHFLGRRTPSEKLPIIPLLPLVSRIRIISVEHSFGINLIYGTAIIAWLVTVLAIWLRL